MNVLNNSAVRFCRVALMLPRRWLSLVAALIFFMNAASAFEYKSDGCSLSITSRGAWAGRSASTVPLIPLFNKSLKGKLKANGYGAIRKQASLVSVVGKIASFRVSQSAIAVAKGKSAVARPIGTVYIHVVDICSPRTPKTPVSMRDIFTESEIRQSLLNAPDQDLRANFHRFDQSYRLEAFEMAGLAGDGDFLYQFAFGKFVGGDVELLVQVQSPGFGDGLEVDQFYTLHFNAPSTLISALQAAREGHNGFLVSDTNARNRPSFNFN
jgi:prepilin signal peptidase PulO-like enzyme (type II secretory pathway)